MLRVNIRGKLVEYTQPVVMGIVNATPDSFFAGSRVDDDRAVAMRVEQMLADGVDIIDVGACSTRPGADMPTADEETRRLERCMRTLRRVAPHTPVSVDTFRASVARTAVAELGCDIVNDISGGLMDPLMIDTVAQLQCPYVLMHTRGTPATMQSLTDYPGGVVAGVISEIAAQVHACRQAGIADIIIDPGFGFAKTVEQNYELMRRLPELRIFGAPILVGISRKSMLTRPLGIDADQALNATTALNALALDRGAAILRVHDVAAARQCTKIYSLLNHNS